MPTLYQDLEELYPEGDNNRESVIFQAQIEEAQEMADDVIGDFLNDSPPNIVCGDCKWVGSYPSTQNEGAMTFKFSCKMKKENTGPLKEALVYIDAFVNNSKFDNITYESSSLIYPNLNL